MAIIQKKQICVAGFGNIFRCDDGVGIFFIKRLKEILSEFSDHPSDCAQLEHVPSDVIKNLLDKISIEDDILDLGLDSFALIGLIQQYHRIVVVDAARMGLKVGEFRIFDLDSNGAVVPVAAPSPITTQPQTAFSLTSVHGFDLTHVLKLLKISNCQTDQETQQSKIIIFGIEPNLNNVDFGEQISQEIVENEKNILKGFIGLIVDYL